jgi:CRISPR-associated protein Cas2
MNFLIVYDVDTTTREGQARLRRVARACEGYGQRVQYSVFEVICSRNKMAALVAELEVILAPGLDSVRIYPMDGDGFERAVHLGPRREIPHEDAWVL